MIYLSRYGQFNIKGAIVPHHSVASSMVHDLALRLTKVNPTSIIIIGPNHNESGNLHFITDNIKFASVEVELNPTIVQLDHACTQPLNILKEYLPQTHFSCILVSARVDQQEVERLVEQLTTQLPNGVLVASVDFSHYLSLHDANRHDLITKIHLDAIDPSPLQQLDNSYLDSPRSILILFEYLASLGVSRSVFVNHSNSSIIQNQPSLNSTTSYFEYLYF